MQVLSVLVDSIQVDERHRALNEDAVERLTESIKEIGLRQPISVRIDGEGETHLVAGRHRLEVARRLGWSQIDCLEVDDDALKAELWEIAENLHRFDLTKDQRDEHIRRYADILVAIEARKAEAKIQVQQNASPEIGYKQPPPQQKGIARQIAEQTGLSADTVRRALRAPEAQPEIPVRATDAQDAASKQAKALMRAWNRANRFARAQFLKEAGLKAIREPQP